MKRIETIAGAGLIPLDICSDGGFRCGVDGVETIYRTGDGKVEFIQFEDRVLAYVRSAMGYTGSANMETMRTRPEFVRVTSAGMAESHVHDVSITKEAPNYPVR